MRILTMTALCVSDVSASAMADCSQLLAASAPDGPPAVTPNAPGLDWLAAGAGRAAGVTRCGAAGARCGVAAAGAAVNDDDCDLPPDMPGTGGSVSLISIFCMF